MSAIDIDAPAQTEVRTTAGIWLRDRALAERERWALWLPVCLGIGIGVYFRITVEPPLWLGVALASLLLGGVIALRRAGPAAVVLIALFTAAAGFALAELRCHLIATPMLDKSFGPAEIEGRVLGVDQTASGHRLLLDQLQVAGLPSAQTPARVRLSLRGAVDPVLVPGQHVRLRAMLRPASPPSAPGAFDFQRFLFFAGIGATGNAYAPIGLVPAAPGEAPDAAIWLARLRAAITARVLAVLPGDVGAVAAALVAGDETKISIPMQQAYRDSGLFHLLSISGRGWWRIAVLYVGGLVFSSLLATIATAPFAAFHFNRMTNFGLIANMVAVPLSGVLVMPAALVGVVLMPFGWEALGLVPMGWGIAIINDVAVAIAGWPAAVIRVPAFPIDALAVIVLGALWLCLWRTRWRWGGVAMIAAGCLAAFLARPPDLLISPDGRLMAVNPPGGHLMMSSLTGQRFTAEAWLARFAEDQPGSLASAGGDGGGGGLGAGTQCDRFGCLYRAGTQLVALVTDARALAEDCRIATVLISAVPVRVGRHRDRPLRSVAGRCPRALAVRRRRDGRERARLSGRPPVGARARSSAT